MILTSMKYKEYCNRCNTWRH